jgi:hypothetical protein
MPQKVERLTKMTRDEGLGNLSVGRRKRVTFAANWARDTVTAGLASSPVLLPDR